jgi:hypothetical protein
MFPGFRSHRAACLVAQCNLQNQQAHPQSSSLLSTDGLRQNGQTDTRLVHPLIRFGQAVRCQCPPYAYHHVSPVVLRQTDGCGECPFVCFPVRCRSCPWKGAQRQGHTGFDLVIDLVYNHVPVLFWR